MSNRAFRGTGCLRVVLAVVVTLDLLSLYSFLGEARADALAAGASLGGFDELLSRAAVRGAVILIGIAAAVGFARRAGRLWHGLVALTALMFLSTVHTHLFGSPWRHLFFGGLCLAGWLAGLAVSRHRGAPADEGYACTGSVALLGAAYLNSGISKLVFGGSTWVSGLPVQSAIVAQNGLIPDGIAAAYRSWVATTPAVARLYSVATVAFELSGPLMLVGRRMRIFVALGLLSMHASIFFLTGHILYWESMVLLLCFGLSPAVPAERSPHSAAVSHRPRTGRFAVAVAVLAVAALFAIAHQARRFALRHEESHKIVEPPGIAAEQGAPPRGIEPGEAPTPMPTVSVLQRVGPFAIGQVLAEGWTIDAFDLDDDGFAITVAGEAGRVRFDITCASRGGSPFDVGAAHILYSRHVGFEELEAAGKALQEQFRKATEGREVCERIQSWRAAARASLPG